MDDPAADRLQNGTAAQGLLDAGIVVEVEMFRLALFARFRVEQVVGVKDVGAHESAIQLCVQTRLQFRDDGIQ